MLHGHYRICLLLATSPPVTPLNMPRATEWIHYAQSFSSLIYVITRFDNNSWIITSPAITSHMAQTHWSHQSLMPNIVRIEYRPYIRIRYRGCLSPWTHTPRYTGHWTLTRRHGMSYRHQSLFLWRELQKLSFNSTVIAPNNAVILATKNTLVFHCQHEIVISILNNLLVYILFRRFI
jgi:hypothetical protein